MKFQLSSQLRRRHLYLVVLCLIGLGLSLTLFNQRSLLAAPSAQSTAVTATNSVVIRPGGATLYTQPAGVSQATLFAGSLVTATARTEDNQWLAVQTQEGSRGWVAVDEVFATDFAALPVSADAILLPESSPAASVLLPTVTPTPIPEAIPVTTALVSSAEISAAAIVAAVPVAMPVIDSTAIPSTGTSQMAVISASGADLLETVNGNLVSRLTAGTLLAARARSTDSGWVLVQLTEDPAQSGWVAAREIYLADLAGLPVVDATGSAQAESVTPTSSEAVAVASTTAAEVVQATVASGENRLNVRSGPSTSNAIIATALDGEQYTLLGRNSDSSWLLIDTGTGNVASYGVTSGWVSAAFVIATGDVNSLPVVESQTPQPTDTVTSVTSDLLVTTSYVEPAAAESPADVPSASTSDLSGTLVFQSSPGGMIYAYDLATGALRSLTNGFDPAISPDGSTVAFVRESAENGIYLVDINGENERLIYSGNARLSSPKWSPDGNWIVFTRGDQSYHCYEMGGSCVTLGTGPNGEEMSVPGAEPATRYWYTLARVDRDGQNYRDLASLTSARAADWNEAGIVYQSDAGLQITDDTPTAENQLVIFDYLKPFFEDPDWQSNGGLIAYMGREASHYEIFTVNSDGSGVTALTRPATTLVDELPANVAPAWSPDGQQIVFLSNRTDDGEAGAWRIWVMDAGGSNQRPLDIDIALTYTYGNEQAVSWGPTLSL